MPVSAVPPPLPRKRLNLGFLRRWRRLYAALLGGMVALAAASVINGWDAFVPAQVVLAQQDELGQELPVQQPLPGPVLLVSPHPDDETLGAAGMLQDTLSHAREVYVVFMTAGDGFPWTPAYLSRPWDGGAGMRAFGERRMQESRDALKVLGVPPDHIFFLGFPDRGLTRLEGSFLYTPFTSAATRVSAVPYAGAFRPGAPYTGREVARQLREILRRVKPQVILTTSVLDRHPDHRAAAHFVAHAADEVGARVFFFPVHAGLEWPVPKGHHPDLGLYPPRLQELGGNWRRYPLTGAQVEQKGNAVRAYRSQTVVIGRYMWAFVRRNELLRPAEASPDPDPGTEGRVDGGGQ